MSKSNSSKIKAVELFAGIGGFRIAGEKFDIETVWANDLDNHASKVYVDRFGEESFCQGDIWKLLDQVPEHDLLTGGFPCQPFSAAGKKKGIEDPRGTLFEAIVKILEKHQPKYFILENVKRLLLMDNGKHFATILASLSSLDYRIEWRLLNAMDFSLPQNRQRVVITGVHRKVLSANNTSPHEVTAIKLATTEELNDLSADLRDRILDESLWEEIEDSSSSFPNWGIAYEGRYVSAQLKRFSHKKPVKYLKEIIEKKVDSVFDLTDSTNKWIEKNRDVNKYVGGVEILSNQAGGARMGYTIFGINGVAPTLTSSTSRHYERYMINGRYRRLTPSEYAKIQGFPSNHCDIAPLRERYVLYGNAVPPPLVEWVMGRLLNKNQPIDIINIDARLPLQYA